MATGFALTAGCVEKLEPDQAQYARAYKAYKKGRFTVALQELEPLIQKGHPAAQFLLARMYARGGSTDSP
jgi:TPR repeat protein